MTAASPVGAGPSDLGNGGPSPSSPRSPSSLLEKWWRDPNAIWTREMRAAARLSRTPWALFAVTLVLALLMCSIGGIAAANHTTPAEIGTALFQVFFSLAYLVVVIVGPTVAANGVASEREGRTWEAVLLTGLSPQDVGRGKFLAAYTTIALYIVVLAPVGALPFLFGGVRASEVVVAFLFLFLVAGLAVAFGLAVSSLMSSLRGAIVVTLMLAIVIGPFLYFIFGFAVSFGIHKLWAAVPEAFPIWLPLAYSRAEAGADYWLVLVAIPLLLVGTPAWFLYEATVANLSGEADDRSTGLKRWFFFSTPVLALACAVPSGVARDAESKMVLCIAGLCALSLHLAFCAFLFAGEPPGPSRRVRVHWTRARAGVLRRFFGPGLPKTGLLVAGLGFASVWILALGDMGLLQLSGATPKKPLYLEEVFFFALYAAGFFLFVTGLSLWLRSRGLNPWIARLASGAIILLVSAGPWVVAAIGGVIAQQHGDEWMNVAAPSPFYVLYMMSRLDSAYPKADASAMAMTAGSALAWGLLGLGLLAMASRRSLFTVRAQDAAAAAVAEALRAEDAAALLQAGPPETAPL